jgi:hypothetical protein
MFIIVNWKRLREKQLEENDEYLKFSFEQINNVSKQLLQQTYVTMLLKANIDNEQDDDDARKSFESHQTAFIQLLQVGER